jgi:hypothetical protein
MEVANKRTIVFDVTIMIQYVRFWGLDPVELDREAIKRYLTTDESWVQHRWMALRRKLQFPFCISFHDGPYRRHEEVLEGVQPDEMPESRPNKASKDEERELLFQRQALVRSYGTQ